MNVRWNNLVRRWFVLVLVAMFAVPCIACEDGIAHLLCPHTQRSVQAIHYAALGTDCATCETPHEDGPPCQCLSDASKVTSDRSQTVVVIPDAIGPPMRIALSEPAPVRLNETCPDLVQSPILLHPAVSGRAPPAA